MVGGLGRFLSLRHRTAGIGRRLNKAAGVWGNVYNNGPIISRVGLGAAEWHSVNERIGTELRDREWPICSEGTHKGCPYNTTVW